MRKMFCGAMFALGACPAVALLQPAGIKYPPSCLRLPTRPKSHRLSALASLSFRQYEAGSAELSDLDDWTPDRRGGRVCERFGGGEQFLVTGGSGSIQTADFIGGLPTSEPTLLMVGMLVVVERPTAVEWNSVETDPIEFRALWCVWRVAAWLLVARADACEARAHDWRFSVYSYSGGSGRPVPQVPQ